MFICTYIHVAHTQTSTDTLSTYTDTNSTSDLILLPSLAKQNEDALLGSNIHTHIYTYMCKSKVWIPLSAVLRSSVCPVAVLYPISRETAPEYPSLPTFWYLDWCTKAISPLQLLVQTLPTPFLSSLKNPRPHSLSGSWLRLLQ